MGRFINADAFASTSQDLIGNNMFAYCNNNPVNGCDPCGTCFHRLDFWNDCEKCGGRTIRDKANDAIAFCEEMFISASKAYYDQALIEAQIAQQQIQIIGDSTRYVFDSYAEYMTDQFMIEHQIAREQFNIIGSFSQKYASPLMKIGSGAFGIFKGAELIFAPLPTPIDDLIGVRKITFGVVKFIRGCVELFVEVIKE